jgi:hypothetical protein
MLKNPTKINILSDGLGSCGYSIIESIWHHAFPNCEIIHDELKHPNLVIKSHFQNVEKRNYKCPYILFSGEPYRVSPNDYLPICEMNCFIHPNTFYVPFFSYAYISSSNTFLTTSRTPVKREYMLSYVNRHAVIEREQVFKAFRLKYPTLCHGLGKCQTTRGKQLTNKNWAETHQFIRDYTCHIAMENTNKAGYITEKLFNAYKADCVPIYWGGDGYTDYFINEETYIDCKKFANIEKLMEHTWNIHHDIQKKAQYFSKPVGKKPIFDYLDIINKPTDDLPKWINPIISKLRESFPDL